MSITIRSFLRYPSGTPQVGDKRTTAGVEAEVVEVTDTSVTVRAVSVSLGGKWVSGPEVLAMSANSVPREHLRTLHAAQLLFTDPLQEQSLDSYTGEEPEIVIELSADDHVRYISHPFEPSLALITRAWPWKPMSFQDSMDIGSHLRFIFETKALGVWLVEWD